MEKKEIEQYTKNKLGLRYKQETDGILIYANAWTMIVDVCKYLKLLIKNLTHYGK